MGLMALQMWSPRLAKAHWLLVPEPFPNAFSGKTLYNPVLTVLVPHTYPISCISRYYQLVPVYNIGILLFTSTSTWRLHIVGCD